MEIFIFNSTMKKMKLVLSNKNVMEAHETKEINKAGQLVFSTDFKTGKQIKQTDVVFIHVKEDRYHPYKIVQTSMPTANSIQFTCIEYAYYLFNKDGLVHDKRPNKLSVGDVIAEVIKGTKWQVGYVDSSLPKFTGSFYWITRTECFSKLVEQTGAELEFYMTMSDNQINGRYIDAYKQVGTDTHQRFTYGMNALEVVAESSAVDMATKVYPRGSGEMYTSEGDGERKLTIENIEWSKSKGDPVDKPLGQDYLVYGSSEYDLDNGNQPSAIVEFQDEKDDKALIKRAYEWLKQNNRPQVQFKAKVSEVGDLKLGDRVVIDREDMNIKYVTRVFKIDRNLLNEKLNTIELGDVVATSLADSITNKINESIIKNNTSIKKEFHTIVNANGQTITYGQDEPQTKKKGDTWFKPADIVEGVQQYDVYVWDGEKWVLTIGNQLQNELIAKVDQAQKDTEAAKQQAQQVSDKADQIVIDFNKQIGGINHNIDSAKQDAQNAINQANVAISKADFNNQEITDLKQKQDADGQRISSVEQNYNGLKQTVSDNAEKQESDRVQLSNLIQDKVSNGEFNSFKTQTSSQISSLVSNGGNLFPNAEFNDKNLSSYFNVVYRNATVETGIQANTKTGNYLKIQNTDLRYNTRLEVKGIIPASPGDKLNIAYDYLKNTNTSTPVVGFIARKRDGGDGWYYIRGEKTATDGKWKHIEQTWTVPQNVMGLTPIVMNLSNEDGVAGDYICFDNILITRTDITKTEVTQIQNKISSLAKDQNSVNQRVQTAESTIESIKNMTGSNTIVNTVKGQQQQIQDASGNALNALKTAQGVQTTVSNMQTNILENAGQMDDPSFWYKDPTVSITNGVANIYQAWSGAKYNPHPLTEYLKTNLATKYTTYDFSAEIMLDETAPPGSKLYFFSKLSPETGTVLIDDMSKLTINAWIKLNLVVTFNDFSGDTWDHRLRIECNQNTNWKLRNMRLVYSNKATTKQLSQTVQTVDLIRNEVKDFETNTTGRLDVMSNNINLKVDKDKIINQINVSTEGILIDGVKTHITNQTTIDNAVITSAMIKDISADKIMAGTLNAANVKIVNLDVNDLVGNKTQFVQSAWNSVSNSISINGDGIYSKRSDGSISAKYLSDGIQIWGNGKWLSSISYIEGDDTVFGAKNGTDLLIGYQGNSSPNSYYTSLKISGTDGSVDFKVPKVSFQGKQMQFGVMDWSTGDIPTFKSSSGKVNIGFGGETLWFGDAKGILTLNDIRNGKLDGLSYGGRNVRFSNVRYNNATYFAITSPSMKTGVMWGDSRLYFLLDGSVFPLADILRGATWDI